MNAGEFDRWLLLPQKRALVWGIVNVTPDSFSDGGEFLAADAAMEHARRLIAEGADALDLGAESTRPGSEPVVAEEQIRRLRPLVESIRRESDVVLSIDTTRAAVAEVMLDAGAEVINDIAAGRFDAAMLPLAARRRAPLVLMHMQGEPRTMQVSPTYGDVVEEVAGFLQERAASALASGVERERIILDPGIGFGKNLEHNLLLLRHLPRLCRLGHPLLVGASRKRFIGEITGVANAAQRIHGSTAVAAWSVANGVAILRVHDVAATVASVKMVEAIEGLRRQ